MEEMKIKTRVVGVDVSLDATTYAIVDIRGNIIARDHFCTRDYPNINEYVSQLCDRIIELVDNNGGYETIHAVGISAPSSNVLTGCIENSPNMPWKGVIPLAAMLRDRIGLAVALANNSQCIALGEQAFGSAHGMTNFVVITLGHGMGSALFTNGRLHYGALGFAGEIGHTCIVPEGRECGCGHQGCLETYCAEKGILRTARELMESSNEPSLMRGVEELTPKLISEMCNQGDAMAIEVFRRTGEMLGRGLAKYATLINPQAFILTGGIPRSGKWLMVPAQEAFEQHVFGNIKGRTKLLVSILDDRERDVLGASVLAWTVEEYSLFK
ncbi:MAG: ROK family protein [Prevotella sp.]|nr:ROK family protein [Prevotella sp.]